MRTRGLFAPFLFLLVASPAWGEGAPRPLPHRAVAPAAVVPHKAPAARAVAPLEELQTLLPELKAARRELSGGVVTPARRATIEALVAKVRGVAAKLPDHEVGRAKAQFAIDGVTSQLEGIAAGTLKPPVPDVDIRAAISPRHAPKIPEKELRSAVATWARALSQHASSGQPEKVRGLFEALGRSGYGALEAMDLVSDVLAEELETNGVSYGGWTHHFVEEQVFRIAGLDGTDARPVGWGLGPAAPDAAHLPLHAVARAELHPETQRVLGDLGTIAAARARVARPQVERSAARQGLTHADLDAVRALFRRAPVHVRFRPSAKLLEGLEKDPTWKNVHESGTTAGNTDIDLRKRVERDLGFLDDAAPAGERPKYGYLNVTNAVEGQAGHYGDAVLVLRHEVKRRATVCFGDSFGGGKWEPAQPVTSFDHPDAALAPLLTRESIQPLVQVATGRRSRAPYPYPVASDRYLEVQIFGTVDLRRDVQAIVLGPVAAASPERARLVALAARLGIPVHVTPPSGFADIGFTQ